MNINNKEKKAAGGNWGKPGKFIKKHTNIPNPLVPEVTRYKPDKKYKKKEKKERVFPWAICPFCKKELKLKKGLSKEKSWYFGSEYRENCHECKATHGKKCPCCKRATWFLNGIYKHQFMGCGFEGKKLNLKGR